MNFINEYSSEFMLQTIKDHFESKDYVVTLYSDLFPPARVPIHCSKEDNFFAWSKVTESDNERFINFLRDIIGINWLLNPEINKIDNKIIVTENNKSIEIIIRGRNEKIEVLTDLGKIYNFNIKKENGELIIYKIDEKIIDITTEGILSKDRFFPDIEVKRTTVEKEKSKILEASQLRFYQCYFPFAEIYLAYPEYINENDKFKEFKGICKKKGIGLFKIKRDSGLNIVDPISEPRTFFKEISENYEKYENIEKTIMFYQEEYLKYFVYYPDPIFKRRIITDKMPEMISLIVIDKLQELENLHYDYINELKYLAAGFRNETRDDYEIALEIMRKLWKNRLGLEYPEIQRHIEDILQRKEYYREHFVHQFQVFLIGIYILDKFYKLRSYKDIIELFNPKEMDKAKKGDRIEDVWLAASTYHDFNYGLQEFDHWLIEYFKDTLFIKDEETKERLNILNLDAAMIREYLLDEIGNIIEYLGLKNDAWDCTIKFLYEKVVKDRNHGTLSALSILRLWDMEGRKDKISKKDLIQAAFAIACHDEDIWEAFCGCRGYLKNNKGCKGNCNRKLRMSKEIEVNKKNIKIEHEKKDNKHKKGNNIANKKCEIWENEFMIKEVLKNIEFRNRPILFLLILCDSVQDEGRMTSMINDGGHRKRDEIEDINIELEKKVIKDWYEMNKKLKDCKEYNKKRIKSIFKDNGIELSDEAIMHQNTTFENKWKIVDGEYVYILKAGEANKYEVSQRRKECLISNIEVKNNEIRIDLKKDGREEKIEELQRISWFLKDDKFRIHIEEKDADLEESIVIMNGNDGK